MYIIRNIFQLRFGAWKDAKALLDEAYSKGILPDVKSARVLTEFAGDSSCIIFEEGYDSLTEYEGTLRANHNKSRWQKWNTKFTQFVASSRIEILKQVL